MCSRFTELFHIDHPLKLCQYGASSTSSSSPSASTNEGSFYSSSSETLNYNLTVNSDISVAGTKTARPQNPHSTSFASFFANNDDGSNLFKTNTSTQTASIKSKLKRFMTIKKPSKKRSYEKASAN